MVNVETLSRRLMQWSRPARAEPTRAPARLASFDIFETLLMRPYAVPSDLHEAAWALAGVAPTSAIGDAGAWRRARIAAEQRARQRHGLREITLSEIYEELIGALGLSRDALRRLEVCELAQEARVLRSIEPGRSELLAARAAGMRIAFLSDMYLPSDAVGRFLAEAQLSLPADLLLVSSATGKSKREGDLFDELVRLSAERPIDIVHVGDNPGSDHAVPRARGLQARWVDATAFNRHEQRMLAHGAGSHLLRSVLAGASRLARMRTPSGQSRLTTIRDVSAGVAAPLLTGFVLWTFAEARRLGLNRLYFLARDGQILERIARMLAPRFAPEIACHYLLASRQALYLPALNPSASNAVSRLARMVSGRRLEDAMATLGLDAAAVVPALVQDLPNLTTNPLARVDDAAAGQLAGWLLGSAFRERLVAASEASRAAMLRYLSDCGVLDDDRFAIVDVGWRGNLQRFMADALDAALGESAPRLTGLYFGLIERPPESAGRTFQCVPAEQGINEVLMELFCAADHGTTIGYRHAAGAAELHVLLQSERNEEALQWGLVEQQRAIEAFAESFVDALPDGTVTLEAAAQAVCAIGNDVFAAFQRMPSIDEAEVYGGFPHSVDARHARFAEVAPRVPLKAAFAAMLPGARSDEISWPQGSFVRACAAAGLAPMALAALRLKSELRAAVRRVSR